MAQLVIFGAGDIARLAHHYFTTDSPHRVVAFTVDREYKTDDTFLGLPLCAADEVVARYPPGDFQMFVAMSYSRMNHVRAAKYGEMKGAGYQLESYVSSRCTYLAEPPGDNCFILEDNTIQPFVTIGNDVTLWSGNHIGHDVTIDDHCFITSHVVISGNVTIGRRCFLGVNATVRDGIEIAEGCVIGAGALVMRSTSPNEVYIAPRTKPDERTSEEIGL
jgi:sugar O-acyltransferase (sialic acid O-acetyltransferase NeuD family)